MPLKAFGIFNMKEDNVVFIGIDQGSSSTKACVLDLQYELLYQKTIPVELNRLGLLHVEQSPEEILDSVRSLIQAAKNEAKHNKLQIAGMGLACQRSGVCAWDKATNSVLHNLISWADIRTKTFLDSIKDKHEFISNNTGLPVSPHYAAGKIALLQKEFNKDLHLVATLDSFLINQLSRDKLFITEDSMASRSMLYSLNKLGWDKKLCDFFEVEIKRLPEISGSFANDIFLDDIPLLAFMGDQQAALYSSYLHNEKAVLNLGSIASLSFYTHDTAVKKKGYISGILHSNSESKNKQYKYFIEATTNACGEVIAYICDTLKLAADISLIDEICYESFKNQSSSKQIAFLPLGGTAAPDWRYDLPCVFTSDPLVNKADSVRAAIECIGNFILENIINLTTDENLIINKKQILVSGGVSNLDYLLQYISDCSGFALLRVQNEQATADGIALAEMQSKGFKKNFTSHKGKLFSPKGKRSHRFAKWKKIKQKVMLGELKDLYVI